MKIACNHLGLRCKYAESLNSARPCANQVTLASTLFNTKFRDKYQSGPRMLIDVNAVLYHSASSSILLTVQVSSGNIRL